MTIFDSAVKKQARVLKSVIKLDKNFDIQIHGNRDLIEQGKDEKGFITKRKTNHNNVATAWLSGGRANTVSYAYGYAHFTPAAFCEQKQILQNLLQRRNIKNL